ncbi:MAG: ABC transporter permease [Thermoguttaceae bacterium]
MLRRLLGDYGMILVLLGLCVLFSILTLKRQMPEGAAAVRELTGRIEGRFQKSDVLVAVGAVNTVSAALAENVGRELTRAGYTATRVVVGEPRDLRAALDEIAGRGEAVAAIVTTGDTAKWRVIEQIPQRYEKSAAFELVTPKARLWPDFLKRTNLLAIVDRIVVIAVIAIGMTMVIITGGIDLSVGSLIALSAVTGTLVMKRLGGLDAPPSAVLAGFVTGIAGCGLVGAAGGLVVARFKVAPFITTLSVMMMARGLAFMLTGGFSIYQVPRTLTWLGHGSTLGLPNTVILLVVLYTVAHVFMSRTRMGRYIYAVGGNEEAARLSGVPVARVTVFVYTLSALAAGLGGCIQASQINTGTPNMGAMYELYVIAAVVVGGTSLSGGSGRILGTLIGAFIISVIQNGMNLLGIESYTQQVVLGGVILGAVLLDKARGGGALASLLGKSTVRQDNVTLSQN